ncbi:hypothetical protein GE09DRAFT_1226067 [Coniochaeta sp. 2T2.1]|nr:hypothetical protein GE09DRAFT_1226067 [Coniochaeta sp. 2T2.1]
MPSSVLRLLGAADLLSSTAKRRQTQSVSNWGDNPSGLSAMIVYIPNKVAEMTAIIRGLHPCGGTGQMYQSMTPLPPTPSDWASNKSLAHNGGGDFQGLVGMVPGAV